MLEQLVTMPLVSTIIPTYNRAFCLPRTIDSVLAQTHSRIEAIIVDDGSTDETADLVARKYGHDPRVRYYYQSNQGVTAARNRGLTESQGDYVALLDSDDVWLPWKIELQLAGFRACPEVGMIWTNMQAIAADGRVVSRDYLRTMYSAYRWFSMADLFSKSYPLAETALPPELAGQLLQVGEIFSQMVMGNLVHTSTVIISRSRIEHIGGFPKGLNVSGEDYNYYLQVCRIGPVGLIDVASIQYQIGMPDHLSQVGHRVYTSRNCLKAVLSALEQFREEIHLPSAMVRVRLAEVYEWVGRSLLDAGERAESRTYLLESLRYSLVQPKVWAMLARASLPIAVGNVLQCGWRRVRSAAHLQSTSGAVSSRLGQPNEK
jgi:GT2 family glycosyltransferase